MIESPSVTSNKNKFMLLVYFCFFQLLVITALVKIRARSLETIFCYFKSNFDDSFPSLDSTADYARLSSGRNIFFLESRCSRFVELDCRQACAIESAAFMNPNMSVNLLFLNPAPPSNRTLRLVELLLTYNNVKIRRVNVQEYIKNTPLERWFSNEVLTSSMWPVTHTCDIMRFLTLWKYGGIYIDLDTVVTKSLEDLKNFVGAEDELRLNPAIIGFSATGVGHKIARMCLYNLMSNFNGKIWAHNGPGVITRVLQNICRVDMPKDMTPERCLDFQVFPSRTFYPVSWPEWKNYFTMTNSSETMRRIKKARMIHVWHGLSSSTAVQPGSKVPYDLVAAKYCSRVYLSCGASF